MAKPIDLIHKSVGSFLGVGYFPAGPGTAATAVGLAIVYLLRYTFFYNIGLIIVLFALGVFTSGYLEKSLNTKDPGIVVIDEVVGIMVSLLGLPLSWPVAVCGFFLFRAFDMFKIYPISYLESLPGGWGIMLDDVMAGLYTNIILSIAMRWAGWM